jgi:hypothetical protein
MFEGIYRLNLKVFVGHGVEELRAVASLTMGGEGLGETL